MKNISRRNWLQLSGLTGAAVIAGNPLNLSASERSFSTPVSGPIRLSSNENPYGPSPKVRAAMTDAFHNVCRYPSGWYKDLVDMLAKKHGVNYGNIMLTAGSTEGLKMAGITYGGEGSNVVSADPVFLALSRYAEHFGAYIHKVPVNKEMIHDLEAMEMRITQSTRLVYVCNPNNPTSALQPATELESFCSAVSKRTVVFADEAYFDYIQDPNYPSMIELVKKDMNVIVARTFSKVYGLAGIRIGYLVARPDIIKRIGKSVMAGPNILAVAAGKAALQDDEFYKYSLEKTAVGKKMVLETLDDLGLTHVPSACNFVFFKTGRHISEVNKEFLKHGVIVGRAFPPLTDWCRVSIGKVEEMEVLCRVMKTVLS